MVRIRMQRMGRRHLPVYRINAIEKTVKRDGRVLENLGWYNPSAKDVSKQLELNDERVKQPYANGIEVGWDGALAQARNLLSAARAHGGVAGIASYDCTNEEIWFFKKLMRVVFGQERIAVLPRRADGFRDDILIDADKHPNRRGAKAVAGSAMVVDPAAYLAGKGAVIVLDADPLNSMHSEALKRAFAAVKSKIVLASQENESSHVAAVVLPTAAFAEKDGTWMNRKGHIQRLHRGLRSRHDSKSDLEVIGMIAESFGQPIGTTSAADVFTALAAEVGEFTGLTWSAVGRLGRPAASPALQGGAKS